MRAKVLRVIVVLVAIAALFLLNQVAVFAVTPYGPDNVTVVSSSTRTSFDAGAKQVAAEAGNVTQLDINITTQTDRWQGYFGNISGWITLDDAKGNSMYDWTPGGGGMSPTGNIYAANETVSNWGQVKCFNTSADQPGFNCTGTDEWCLNITHLEAGFGIGSSDADGVDETFSIKLNMTIDGTEYDCPATHLYQNNASQTTTWNETLLTINDTNNTIIYAAMVDQDTVGFDGRPWDFQLMVTENGDVAAVTTYYFYVELT
jgi:hypothetical protein